VLFAVALLGGGGWRRVAYALGGGVVLSAAVLSFSKGALLLGIPASLGVVGVVWLWRWLGGGPFGLAPGRRAVVVGALAVAGVAAAAGLAFGPLAQIPRFANLLDLSSGTSFFRVRLWGSALALIRDHPWLGVGPDNFLYAYRGQYINPEAWQEPNLSHAHNFALDFAARLGLPGLAVIVWLLIAFFRDGLAALRPAFSAVQGEGRGEGTARSALAVGLLASMVNFLAHGMVDASFFFVDLAFVFCLTVGLMRWLAAATEQPAPPP
jgi:O-antigen ligase